MVGACRLRCKSLSSQDAGLLLLATRLPSGCKWVQARRHSWRTNGSTANFSGTRLTAHQISETEGETNHRIQILPTYSISLVYRRRTLSTKSSASLCPKGSESTYPEEAHKLSSLHRDRTLCQPCFSSSPPRCSIPSPLSTHS